MGRPVILVILDGLGDVPCPELNGETPLESATTPTLDRVAETGLSGLIDPGGTGLACGSDTAHLALLGYEPEVYYRGRGALEALGTGMKLKEGDVAFKCNLATVDESGIVTRRRASRELGEDAVEMCRSLDKMKLPSFPDVEVSVKHATGHRCCVAMSGPNLTDRIVATDPLVDNLRLCAPGAKYENDEAARRTGEAVAELSQSAAEILSSHPITLRRKGDGQRYANCLLLRGAGSLVRLPQFNRFGAALAVAPTRVIMGLAESMGMDVYNPPSATGKADTDMDSKALAAADAVGKGYGFVLVHVKAVDDAGHDRDAGLKVSLLQRADRMVDLICKHVGNAIVCVTGDHTTPVRAGDHTHEPVPVALSTTQSANEALSGESGTNRHARFTEVGVANGGLGRFEGVELMSLLERARDRWL